MARSTAAATRKRFVNRFVVMTHCPNPYGARPVKLEDSRGTAGGGVFSGNLDLPAQPKVARASDEAFREPVFHCRTITLDRAANRLGFVWSLGREIAVGGPARWARVFQIGDLDAKTASFR